jgi:hypothetical protein
MNLRARVLIALGLLAVTSQPLAAQNDRNDFAAWAAMMFTPYGALPPVVTSAMSGNAAKRNSGGVFELRYGHWGFEREENGVHTGALGARFGRVGAVVGYESCSGCTGNIIGGVDYDATVVSQQLTGNGASSLFTVGLRPAVGFGHTTKGAGGSEVSGTVDVPFAVAVPVGTAARVVPFFSPGFGFGSVRGGGESETGTRASIAFGVGVIDLSPGLGLNLSWRKIFLHDAPMTIGLGLTLGH